MMLILAPWMAIAEATTNTTNSTLELASNGSSPLCTCLCPVKSEVISLNADRLIEQTIITTLATVSILGTLFGLGKISLQKLGVLIDSSRERRGSYRIDPQTLPLSTTV